jgi:Tfp pilus assembly protein PilF
MKVKLFLCIVLAVITLAVYWQTSANGFISYDFDDTIYVVKNPHISPGITSDNIIWAFKQTYAANWHPLTWLSHMLDCQLYGLNPRGHHYTNILIHTLSSVLLFLLLVIITGALWQGFLVAALFALHPLHVESVAWIAERKDVLSGFFWILTLLLYTKYSKKPGRTNYILTLCAFVAGLMSKSMLVTLPLVMLLFDYWPLNRFRTLQGNKTQTAESGIFWELFREKLPFFILSACSAVITIYAQNQGTSLVSLTEVPVSLRIENAIVAYAQYVVKMLAPHDLAIFYPLRPPLHWHIFCSLLGLVLIAVAAWWWGKRFRYLLTGWLWFVITMLPVIGLLQVGDQAMADRYTYLPYIGLFIMFSWGIADITQKISANPISFPLMATTIIAICVVLTNQQLKFWKNDTALFSHALNVTQDNYKVHNALGVVLAKQKRFDEAFKHFSTAIRILPTAIIPYYNMGIALESSGRDSEAAPLYLKVISLNPGHVEAHTQLGGIFCREGNYADAFSHFSSAISLNPDYYPARVDLSNCLKIYHKHPR